MKKLSKLKLKAFHKMNDSEMKSVVGGYDSEGYGTCGVTARCGGVVVLCERDMSKSQALSHFQSLIGGHCSDGSKATLNWCCDSCIPC